MERLPTSPEQFDNALRQLQRQAESALSPATLSRLRQARQQAASAAAKPSPWRRGGWWLASACSAVLAVTVAVQFHAPPASPSANVAVQAANDADDTLLPDESPELYLWLGSNDLALESTP